MSNERMLKVRKTLGQNLSSNTTISLYIMALLAIFLFVGYTGWDWTGFGAVAKDEKTIPAKTLWDWMDLLIVPVVLAFGAWFFRRAEAKTEREVASEHAQEAALEEYLNHMSELLLNHDLSSSVQDSVVRDVARTRTLTVLRRLVNGTRKAIVVQFLYEAGLINRKNPVIKLKGADLANAWLFNVDLSGVNLSFANLRGANLSKTNLNEASLEESILAYAKLMFTTMNDSDLRKANFLNASLFESDLSRADLTKAMVNSEQLNETKSLEGAILRNGSKAK